ncbi:MAG: J domain-containing protein [Alcanivoracaceae bacterium]
MDFITGYRVLGLDPECDWDSARQRYQQLVSRYHPDRTGPDADTATLAEINRAWRPLRHHYQTHGFMPLQSTDCAATSLATTPFDVPQQPARRSRYRIAIIAILIPAWVIIMNREQPSPSDPPHAMQTTLTSPSEVDKPTEIIPLGRLGAGDSLGHVIELLGPPDETRGTRWYYGNSWIDVRDGRVSDWYSSADHPLPSDTLSSPIWP